MEVVAGDVVRALEREAVVTGDTVASYYLGIAGFQAFAMGTAASIAGLEVPDGRTLGVRLLEPNGALANLFAMPNTAPIRPNPARPGAKLGIAQGHDDGYGRFLVGTGPYMLAGSQEMDSSVPPDERQSVSGFAPAWFDANGYPAEQGCFTLVRNPSWKSATDGLREACVDEIRATVGLDRPRPNA